MWILLWFRGTRPPEVGDRAAAPRQHDGADVRGDRGRLPRLPAGEVRSPLALGHPSVLLLAPLSAPLLPRLPVAAWAAGMAGPAAGPAAAQEGRRAARRASTHAP